jgi:hypothetical protein
MGPFEKHLLQQPKHHIVIFENHLLQHQKKLLQHGENNKGRLNSKEMGSRCRQLQPWPITSELAGGRREGP